MISKEQKYYKVLTKDLRAPTNTEFSYREWQTKTFKVEGLLRMCRNGLHLYKSLKNISIGNFGERVFEAKPVGEYISDEDKMCCREVKLIKELKAEDVKDSEWAYHYCCEVEDKPEVRKNIIDSQWAYYYCHRMKDSPEIYNNITESRYAYYYCLDVKDRPEICKRITDSVWAYWYCHDVEDRPEIYKHIINSEFAYRYCHNIKDRPEVYKNIKDSGWAYAYCHYVKSRYQVYKNISVFSLDYWCCFLNQFVDIIMK